MALTDIYLSEALASYKKNAERVAEYELNKASGGKLGSHINTPLYEKALKEMRITKKHIEDNI